MSERIIAEWQLNARERFRVRLDVYQDRDIIDLRRWFSTGGGDDYRPGNKGVTIAVRHVPALAEALNVALAQARAAGLIGAVGSETSSGPAGKRLTPSNLPQHRTEVMEPDVQ